MKTGLLKWKPDYEGASVEYGKAGKCSVKTVFYCAIAVTFVCFIFILHYEFIIVVDVLVCHNFQVCCLFTFLIILSYICGLEFCPMFCQM